MKEKKREFRISCIMTIILFITLYLIYPLFAFHTYDRQVLHDTLVEIQNDELCLNNYEVYSEVDQWVIGYGQLELLDEEKYIPGDYVVEIKIQLENNQTAMVQYKINVVENQKSYVLDNITKSEDTKYIQHHQIQSATLKIYNSEEEKIFSEPLTLTKAQQLVGYTKKYTMKQVFVEEDFMRLGKFEALEDLKEQYDHIVIEYRYVEGDSFKVFKKIDTTLKDYEKMPSQVYHHDINQGSLLDKQISAVIILSKGEVENIFSLDLNLGEQTDEIN